MATIPNVTVGQTYNIRLRHFTYDNVYSSVVALSDLTITAVTAIPATPTNLAVASDNPLLIGVSWTNPSNTDLRAVKVYRKTVDNTPTSDSDGLVETIYGEPGQKSLFFFGKQDGLSAGTTYFFWVRAVNHSGVNSAFSSSVSGSFKNIVAGDVDTTFSNTIAFKSNLTDGATIISGNNIQTGTLNADRIGTGTLNGSNVSVTNLSATNITGGTLSVDRIGANSLNIASKGVLGSAGNIKSGTGQIQQTTNSTGTVNQFFNSGSLTSFSASSPFHKSGSTSLGEIASVSFSTPSNTATYNFLGFHGVTGFFNEDEEKLIVISIQNTSGTVIADSFQYVNNAQATDIFGIALTQSLTGGNNFVARLYAGTKNVTTSGGVIRITGTVMAFGLGL